MRSIVSLQSEPWIHSVFACAVGAADRQRIGIDDKAVEPAQRPRVGRHPAAQPERRQRRKGVGRALRPRGGTYSADAGRISWPSTKSTTRSMNTDASSRSRWSRASGVRPAGTVRRQTTRAAAGASWDRWRSRAGTMPSAANVSDDLRPLEIVRARPRSRAATEQRDRSTHDGAGARGVTLRRSGALGTRAVLR